MRSKRTYGWRGQGRYDIKEWTWWTLFLNQEDGSQLDTFIGNTVLGEIGATSHTNVIMRTVSLSLTWDS